VNVYLSKSDFKVARTRDARFLTFKVQGNGNVTAGAVTLECCPQNTPIVPGQGSGSDGLDGVDQG
jgi:hypothetical protein